MNLFKSVKNKEGFDLTSYTHDIKGFMLAYKRMRGW